MKHAQPKDRKNLPIYSHSWQKQVHSPVSIMAKWKFEGMASRLFHLMHHWQNWLLCRNLVPHSYGKDTKKYPESVTLQKSSFCSWNEKHSFVKNSPGPNIQHKKSHFYP